MRGIILQADQSLFTDPQANDLLKCKRTASECFRNRNNFENLISWVSQGSGWYKK